MIVNFDFPAPDGFPRKIIAQSPAMLSLMERAKKAAETNVSVLLTGEPGTGKESVARFIHSQSQRKNAPFVPIQRAATPQDLVLSELFGHVKGAFTGAVKDKVGLFEEANQGTVLLEEVGQMEIGLQSKILRFMAEGGIRRVGDNKLTNLDIRFITTTKENLESLVEQNKFLRDLYFRLAVVILEIPPLRKRPEDIQPIADYLLDKYSQKHEKTIVRYETDALDFMLGHKWPGNVAEMENTIESAIALSSTPRLSLRDFQQDASGADSLDECNLEKQIQLAELKCLKTALSLARGEISRATRLVGLKDNRKKFYDLLKKHQIDPIEYRRSSNFFKHAVRK